jgi:transcription initiation factor TFIIB
MTTIAKMSLSPHIVSPNIDIHTTIQIRIPKKGNNIPIKPPEITRIAIDEVSNCSDITIIRVKRYKHKDIGITPQTMESSSLIMMSEPDIKVIDNNESEITVDIHNASKPDMCDSTIKLSPTKKRHKSGTKKNKVFISPEEKSKMWKAFYTDKSDMKLLNEVSTSDDNIEIDLCSECKYVLMIMEDGFPACTNKECGIIYKNTLDYSPEWRYYGATDKNSIDPTRCGNPINPLLAESSFGCKIVCDGKSSYEMRKIRKWTEWLSVPHREKSLYEEFQFISIMAQNAGISKIFIDYAMIIHKDISEQKMFRGVNRDGIKAASIYISCRLNGCPRTAYEIADIFRLDKPSATNGCSTAINILQNIERNVDLSQKSVLITTTPSVFIERFCSKVNIPHELVVLAKFIAHKVETQNIICDNIPQAISAGIIYFISVECNLGISKLEIKSVCGVSEVTINKCFRKLEAIKDKLIPECLIQKYNV